MKLVENIVLKGKLLETKAENLPEGVLCRVEYPICNVGVLNANKRIYEAAVWEHVLANECLQRKMQERCLFGHAEHPEGSQSNLECTSHVIFETKLEEDASHLYQTMDVLDTPAGRIVDTLLRAGCNVGVSTRAEGELEECEDQKFGKYSRVIPESYNYITTDFTADPSTFDMAPISVRRNAVKAAEAVCRGVATEGERSFAVSILESVSCGKKTCGKCGCGACDVLTCVKEGTWSIPLSSQSAAKLAAVMEEPILAKDATDVLWDLFGTDALFDAIQEMDPEDDVRGLVKDHLKNVISDYAENPERFKQKADREALISLRSIIDEAESMSSVYDQIIDLRVSEGCVRAERDHALEVLDSIQMERNILLSSVKESKSEEKQTPKMVVVEKSSMDDLKKINKLEESLAVSDSKIKKMEKQISNLSEARQLATKRHAVAISVLESKHQKALKEEKKRVTEAAVRSFVKQYAAMKVSEFGITLHEAHQALLEDCTSVAQVNDVFERIINALRESALHSEVPEDIVITESVKPTKSKKLDEEVESRVGLAFTSM